MDKLPTLASTINELTHAVQNGFRAKQGDILGMPIFNLTYAMGHTIDWNSIVEDVPDQVTVGTGTHYYSAGNSLLLEDQNDYDRQFSASIKADYSGVTYSGSASSSMMYHGTLFSSSSRSYALDFRVLNLLTFQRNAFTKADFDAQFLTRLNQLPPDIGNQGAVDQYFEFFRDYGSHYFDKGSLGGTIVMETSIDDSLFKTSTALEIQTAISAGYEGVVTSGKLSVEAAYKSSTFLEQHRHQIQIMLQVMGGMWAPDEPILAWQESVYKTPLALLDVPGGPALTSLPCISDLARRADLPVIKTNIETLLPKYLAQDNASDGLIGHPKPIQTAAIYDPQMLQGDGFVLATIGAVANGDRGYATAADDPGDNPRTVRAKASQHSYTDHDRYVAAACMGLPSPSKDGFVVQFTPTSGQPKCTAYHLGIGDIDNAALGAWADQPFGQDFTPASDGFVVAWIDYDGRNGARGSIMGWQISGGTKNLIAGSSQHYYSDSDVIVPCNSFCMPVRKAETYRIDYDPTSGTPAKAAYFLPMSDALYFFDGYQTRPSNTAFHAATDGFLVACIQKLRNGDRAQVDLLSHPDLSLLDDLGLLASTSIHYYEDHDIHLPYNTATIPVAKGNYCKARFTTTSGSPNLALHWLPLTGASR